MRCVKFHKQIILKAGLLHCKVRARVLKLFGKGNAFIFRQCREILSEISRKIERDFLRLFGVLCNQIVNAHHRVVDEMRPHLQYIDACLLLRNLLLLPEMVFYLCREYQTEHGNRGKHGAAINKECDIGKGMYH